MDPFEVYKHRGGLLDQKAYEGLNDPGWIMAYFGEGADAGWLLGFPYVTASELGVYTKISMTRPDRDPVWKWRETCKATGKDFQDRKRRSTLAQIAEMGR